MLLDNLARTLVAWMQIFRKCDTDVFWGFLALAQVFPTLKISAG
jgi:hypothetical protein